MISPNPAPSLTARQRAAAARVKASQARGNLDSSAGLAIKALFAVTERTLGKAEERNRFEVRVVYPERPIVTEGRSDADILALVHSGNAILAEPLQPQPARHSRMFDA